TYGKATDLFVIKRRVLSMRMLSVASIPIGFDSSNSFVQWWVCREQTRETGQFTLSKHHVAHFITGFRV
ncbi:hypothetical protein D039_2148B, partial [Vibrio parahaemolyticus EKP-028]